MYIFSQPSFRPLALTLVLLALTTALPGQSVKTSNEKAEITYLSLPSRPLPKEVRTYSQSVSATDGTRATYVTALKTLENAIDIPGYRKVEFGDVHVELIPSAFVMDKFYAKSNGDAKAPKFLAYVPAYMSVTMRILARGGEVLHEEVFGPAQGAPAAGASSLTTPVPAYAGSPLRNPNSLARYDVRLSGEWPTEAALKKAVLAEYGRHVVSVRDQVANQIALSLASRLSDFGFRQNSTTEKLPRLKADHPETAAFEQASTDLIAGLEMLKPGEGVDAAWAKAAAAMTYFEDLAAKSSGDEKEVRKLREAALENLLTGYYYFDQVSELQAALAALGEDDRKQFNKQFQERAETLATELERSPLPSRYAATFTQAEGHFPVPSDATLTATFGLKEGEIVEASKTAKIGLTEVETEYEGRASGGKGGEMVFKGVASPRIVRGNDGASSMERLLLKTDEPAVLGENVRAYTVKGADNVVNLNFDRVTQDSLFIGNRTFVKLPDVKLSIIERSMISLPTWYEIVYTSPKVQVYQHAYTPYEIKAKAVNNPNTAIYLVRAGAEKPFHSHSLQTALTPIKSLAKYLDCPAVNEFVEGRDLSAQFYSYQEIAAVYDGSCGS